MTPNVRAKRATTAGHQARAGGTRYILRTEQAYINWVRALIRFRGLRHPATLGDSELEAFLSWLANERKVSVSTHRQALAALLFLYGTAQLLPPRDLAPFPQ